MNHFPHISHAAATDVGRKRKNNEDAFGAYPAIGAFCVADGMGGGDDGEVASAAVVGAIESFAAAHPFPENAAYSAQDVAEGIKSAVNGASGMIFDRSVQKHLKGCGSTFVGVCLDASNPSDALALHAGDSRLYRIRGKSVKQITRDHSAAALIGAKDEAEVNPMFRGMILRAVGVQRSVEIDTTPFQVKEGDSILMCSDGLYRLVPEKRMASIVAGSEDPAVAVKQLIEEANKEGGVDNITAVLVKIGKLPPAMPTMPFPQDMPANVAGQEGEISDSHTSDTRSGSGTTFDTVSADSAPTLATASDKDDVSQARTEMTIPVADESEKSSPARKPPVRMWIASCAALFLVVCLAAVFIGNCSRKEKVAQLAAERAEAERRAAGEEAKRKASEAEAKRKSAEEKSTRKASENGEGESVPRMVEMTIPDLATGVTCWFEGKRTNGVLKLRPGSYACTYRKVWHIDQIVNFEVEPDKKGMIDGPSEWKAKPVAVKLPKLGNDVKCTVDGGAYADGITVDIGKRVYKYQRPDYKDQGDAFIVEPAESVTLPSPAPWTPKAGLANLDAAEEAAKADDLEKAKRLLELAEVASPANVQRRNALKSDVERRLSEKAEAERKAREEAEKLAKMEESRLRAREEEEAEAKRKAAEKKAEAERVRSSAVDGLIAKLGDIDARTRFLKFVDVKADDITKTNLNDAVKRILAHKSLSDEGRWLASIELVKFARQFFSTQVMDDAKAKKDYLNGAVHNSDTDEVKVKAEAMKSKFNAFFEKLEHFVELDPKNPSVSTVVLLAELIDITPGCLDLK